MQFRVGRLFWKFFLAFFLSQMLTTIGVGLMIWLAGPEPHLPEPEMVWREDGSPPPPPGCPEHPGPPGAPPEERPAPPDERPAPPPGHAVGDCPPAGPAPASPAAAPGVAGNAPLPDAVNAAVRADRALWRHRHESHGRWFEVRRHGFPFLPVGIGLLASVLSAYLSARHFAGPILALRSAFGELGRGNLKLRLGPGSSSRPDELESLRNDFDASASRLELLVEGQRRLLHDVSHEVRSPVARLQLALDLIDQQPQRAEELLGRMQREVSRIDHLVEELLTLSRLEARAYGPLDQPVDLGELLHAIAEDGGFEGQAREIRVELDCPQELLLRGHPELLHRAIENVLRNALNHSPGGGVVRILATAGQPGRPIQVIIEDQGPGVPPPELERMFQPFKRLGTTANGDGHGLGLAITREAMAAHGGRAYAENRPEGGLRVVLELGG